MSHLLRSGEHICFKLGRPQRVSILRYVHKISSRIHVYLSRYQWDQWYRWEQWNQWDQWDHETMEPWDHGINGTMGPMGPC